MLLRLWSRQKSTTEVQRQSDPYPRDCKNQIRMKKAGRKSRVSEGETCLFRHCSCRQPGTLDYFSEHFLNSESEGCKATWLISSSDSQGFPFLVDSNNIRL